LIYIVLKVDHGNHGVIQIRSSYNSSSYASISNSVIGSESEGEKEEQMIYANPVAGIAIGTGANMANLMYDP
jgi:hypothetical protein